MTDTVKDKNEKLTLKLGTGTNYTLANPKKITITIVNVGGVAH